MKNPDFHKLGYACINKTLSESKPKIFTGRGMIKATFQKEGLHLVGERALQNARDLLSILKWNEEYGIKVFRIGSGLFPWASEYEISKLPQYSDIRSALEEAGSFAKQHGHRLTTHPGQFNVLVSPKSHVVENTIKDLEIHGEMFDLLGLSRTPFNKINIHCNGVYGDKDAALSRFENNFGKLSESVRSRLTIENDDKASQYTVKDLTRLHESLGIPIVFDFHHFKFNTGGQTEQEAFETAMNTWDSNIRPIVHYSESKAIHENDSSIKGQAHSDMINELPHTYGYDVDIMVEAKSKELAILPFRTIN